MLGQTPEESRTHRTHCAAHCRAKGATTWLAPGIPQSVSLSCVRAGLLVSVAGYPLLIIHELGYLTLKPEQANPFFEFMDEHYGTKSTITTTNLPYPEWYELFERKSFVTPSSTVSNTTASPSTSKDPLYVSHIPPHHDTPSQHLS